MHFISSRTRVAICWETTRVDFQATQIYGSGRFLEWRSSDPSVTVSRTITGLGLNIQALWLVEHKNAVLWLVTKFPAAALFFSETRFRTLSCIIFLWNQVPYTLLHTVPTVPWYLDCGHFWGCSEADSKFPRKITRRNVHSHWTSMRVVIHFPVDIFAGAK